MVRRDSAGGQSRLVLATDLDGTLVGDGPSLVRLNKWIRDRRDAVAVVYLTGRHSGSASGLIECEGLVRPDVLVCNVGAEIRFAPSYDPDPAWEARVREGWNQALVCAHLKAKFPHLVYHDLPTELRLAYHTDSGLSETRAAVADSLRNAGLPATVVVSTGGFMDVIPAQAGKGRALRYVMQVMGWEDRCVIVCGDSGNDLDMLLLGLNGVVVGNATEEVLGVRLPEAVYRACGQCAEGIIEGLCHHGFMDERDLGATPEDEGWRGDELGKESAG